MSYILDALRKSEQERRQAEPVVLVAEAPRTAEPVRRDAGAPMTALAVAAAVAVLAAAWWVFSLNLQSSPRASALGAAAPTAPAEVPAARESPGTSPPAAKPPAAAKTPGETAAAHAVAAASPAPELQPSPFAAPPARGPQRDLAEEARVDAPAVRNRPAPVRRARAPAPAANPAEPAEPAALAEPAVQPVKFLRAMPDAFRGALPPLAVTIHIYAPRAADRILYINNRQYQAGDRVGEGIRVERIVEDGAVLSYRGQRFKLPRPS